MLLTNELREDERISLVMATVGRYVEPQEFVQSLLRSEYDLKRVELVVVDQNNDNRLEKQLKQYTDKMKIIYLRVNQKGLSAARNIGLEYCSGSWIGFPDDDCQYFPETLQRVKEAFLSFPQAQAIMGGIKDQGRQDRIRSWPKDITSLTKWNFYTKFSSVGLFVRKEVADTQRFCVRLGAGADFGAAEDADYVYNLLRLGPVIFYPPLEIYHPEGGLGSCQKITSYGLGFGGFCRKNLSLATLLLFVAALGYHFLFMTAALLGWKTEAVQLRWSALASRWRGFWRWKDTNCRQEELLRKTCHEISIRCSERSEGK